MHVYICFYCVYIQIILYVGTTKEDPQVNFTSLAPPEAPKSGAATPKASGQPPHGKVIPAKAVLIRVVLFGAFWQV